MSENLTQNTFIDKLKINNPQQLPITSNSSVKRTFGWKTVTDLREVICSRPWTPIIFTHNRRLMRYYYASYWCVLDFDSGAQLCEAYDWFGEHHHIIGLTRNHQKWKDTAPPCDRFRVCIPWETPIYCAKQYVKNIQAVAKKFGADMKSTDAAHPFFPCQEIVSSSADGKRIKVRTYKIIEPKPFSITPLRRADGRIFEPTWVKGILENGVSDGRNNAIFRVTKELLRYGGTIEEITARIQNSALWQHDEPHASTRTIKSAYDNLMRELRDE